ncbi:hypothetical protein AHF37_01088 [Paragonimus kellicotti]|nr:hypothetical protein AHF37_01088 [Paragonimus kellicotti]
MMTKLASEADRLSDFKHVCYVLYECSNNKWSVTSKDLELILGFLCDLQNDPALELGTFGLPPNGLAFFLVASTSLLIEHLSDVSQFDLFQPITCLVRLLLECIGKSGDLLCQVSTALRCLLDWESLPEIHLDQVVQALEKEKDRICIFKDIQSDRIGLMKNVNMFFRLREPALASELWNEVTQFPDRLLSSEEPGHSSIEASTAEAQFTAHMASVQAFWRYQGPAVILNKLDDLPLITEFSDSGLVLGSIRMAKSLSELLFSALSCTPSNERNRTPSKIVQVYADHRSSALGTLPESIAYRWTHSLTKQLRGGLMRLASSLLRLQKSSTQPPAEISEFVYELNTELAILYRSVEKVKNCDIAYEVREMISAWNCSTGISVLRFIDSMMSDAPSEVSSSVPCDVQYQWAHRVPSWCLSPTQSCLDRSMENPDHLVRLSTGISTCADLVKLVLSLILPDPLASNRLRSCLLFDAPILGPACELGTNNSVNLATLDAPIEPETLELEKQSRMDRFTLLCGQPLQSILIRLAVGLSRSFARLLNPQLSKLVYLLASSNSSACVMALKELNYCLDKPEAASKPWPLWPGSRVFCLLSGHIIDTLRPVETTGLAEELLRNFWTGFLHSIRNCFPQTPVDLASPCRVDISSDLLQFACFLAGQFPSLTAKKALLTQLMTGVCDLCHAAEHMHRQPQCVVQLDNCYRVALRLLVLLRYALHHFYVPPTYLAHQLKPSMALTTTEPPSSRIWQFTAVVTKVDQIVPKLRPWTPDLRAPFFYDLLLPASREAVESVKPVYNLPSPDGLAILSLASQLNYDELFAAPLSLSLMHLWMRTSPDSLASPIRVGNDRRASGPMPMDTILLFMRNIHSLLTVVTTERSTDSSTPSLFHSPSYLLYLIVFLDRLQGKPTGLDARWLLDSVTHDCVIVVFILDCFSEADDQSKGSFDQMVTTLVELLERVLSCLNELLLMRANLMRCFVSTTGDKPDTYVFFSYDVPLAASKPWPLWPGSRVFCLLSGHIIDTLRPVETTGLAEELLRNFWTGFLHSIRNCFPQTPVDLASPCRVDISSDLLQFACFLAGQFPSLTAKKALLTQLMTGVCDSMSCADAACIVNHKCCVQLTIIVIWVALACLVLLRYALHHFYVPPTYLAHQLKPSMALTTTEPPSSRIWQFTAVVTKVDQIVPKLRPWTPDLRAPFFYDLLLPASRETVESVKPVYNLPSPDGLIARLPIRSLEMIEEPVDQCRWIPFCWYSLALSWRLLEILPPSVEFMRNIHSLLTVVTTERSTDSSTPSLFHSPSYLLYLIVFLDRLQGKPTGLDARWLLDCATEELGQGPKATSSTRFSSTNFAESTFAKKGLQAEKQLAREIYRSVCAQTPTTSPTADADTTAVPSGYLPYLSSTASIRALLSSMRPSPVGMSLIFEVASTQLRQAVHALATSVERKRTLITYGQVAYWIGLSHFLGDLSSALLAVSKSIGGPTEATAPCSKSSLPPKGSTAVVGESNKRGAKSRTRHAAGKMQPEQTESESVPEHTTSVTIEVLETLPLESKKESPVSSPTEKVHIPLDTNRESASVLTDEQVTAMQLRSVQTSKQLLSGCINLLSSLVDLVRLELNFPVLSDMHSKDVHSAPCTQILTSLCPDRLTCAKPSSTIAVDAVSSNAGFPAAWLSSSPSRHRLAMTLKLATSAYRSPLATLSTLSADVDQNLDLRRPDGANCYSQLLFHRLIAQLEAAMCDLSSAEDKSTSATLTEQQVAVRLVSRLRVRQLCKLAKTVSGLASHLVGLLYAAKLRNFKSLPWSTSSDERQFRTDLATVARLFLDPVANAMGVNLLYCSLTGISVAQYLACEVISINRSVGSMNANEPESSSDRPLTAPVSMVRLKAKQREQAESLIVQYLDDHLLTTVIRFVTQMSNSKWNMSTSCVFTQLCCESLHYLEVVTGCPRVVKRCLIASKDASSGPISDESNTFPLLRLFGVSKVDASKGAPHVSSRSSDCVEATQPCVVAISYQSALMRLLCTLLLRALNAPTKTRHLFVQLAQQACEICLFGSWHPNEDHCSLLSHWLTAVVHTGLAATADLLAGANNPWLVDILSSDSWSSSTLDAFVETEESTICQALSSTGTESMFSFFAASRDYCPKQIARWIERRARYRIALYFERLCRLLVSDWHMDKTVRQTFCAHVLSEAIGVWRSPALQLAEQMSRPGLSHVKLSGLFSAWSDTFVATLRSLQASYTEETNTADSPNFDTIAEHHSPSASVLTASVEFWPVELRDNIFCAHVLSEAIGVWRSPALQLAEQMSRPGEPSNVTANGVGQVTLPWLVSALRCLVLGCSTGLSHVKLSGLFSAWSDTFVATLRSLQASYTEETNTADSPNFDTIAEHHSPSASVLTASVEFWPVELRDNIVNGYSDLGHPSFVFQRLASLLGDSEDNLAVNTDHSDQADGLPETTRSDGFQRLKTVKKWTSDDMRAILPVSSSEPSDETVTRRRQPLTIITPGAAVIVGDSAHEASTTPVPVNTIDPRVSRHVDSASTLRRSGAVRYKLCPVETSSVSGSSKQPKSGKSGSDSRKSATSDPLRSAVHRNVHRGRVPNLSQQLRIRRLRMIQFLRLLNRKAVSREKHLPTNVTSQRRGSGSSKLPRLISLCTSALTSLSLIPDEAALVAHIRSQLDVEDSEKYRSNLILLLSTSNLVPQATHLLTGSGKDGSSELPCIIDQLASEPTNVSTQQRRRLAIQPASHPAVLDSLSVYWDGTSNYTGRTMTFLLVSDGRLYFHATRPRSVIYDLRSFPPEEFSSVNRSHTVVTYPGQYWWQPSLWPHASTGFDCGSNSSDTCLVAGLTSPLSPETITFGLEQGGLWDLATLDTGPGLQALQSKRDDTNVYYGDSNRELMKRLVDSPLAGPLPVDFFEYATLTEETDATGIPPSVAAPDLTYENLHPILASRTALAWMNFLSAHPPSTQASTTPSTSNSQPRPTSSINVVMCMLRVFQPHRSAYAHFLAISGPEQIASRPTSPDFPVVIDHGSLTGGRMINIYRVDQTMLQAARCQDMGMLELGKLRLVTALLQMRHGQANQISAEEKPTSTTVKSEWLTGSFLAPLRSF